jgi:serine/threonine-protein kinase
MDEGEARLGTRLGNYLLREIIGRGGMGVVYRAEHVYIQKRFAVKVLHGTYFDQPEARERFLREARTASSIDHPNIVGVTDFGEAPDGTVFLVMAHVEGVSLERVLRTEGRLPLFRTLVILGQVARALGAAHERGIIHHDLKPDNIMLRQREGRRAVVRDVLDEHGTLELVEPEGRYDFITVLDFGAAKFFDQAAAGARVVVGTPAYMAPETARSGIADVRSDVYAVGVIFYEMLTGSVPFDGEHATQIMVKHVKEVVPPPHRRCPEAEITPEAERTLMRALDKEPGRRYQTMSELNADLQRCYGSIRFRRSVQVLPAGVSAQSLRRPIPLTQVKRRSPEAPPTPPGTPVPAGGAPPLASPPQRTPMPILLTRRKSGRHATLPPAPDGETTPAAAARPTPPAKPPTRR